MTEAEVLCFHCGMPTGDPPRLNEWAEGEVCPVCRDRLLDELPPIFHRPAALVTRASGPVGTRLLEDAAEPQGTRDWPRLVRGEPDEAESDATDEGTAP